MMHKRKHINTHEYILYGSIMKKSGFTPKTVVVGEDVRISVVLSADEHDKIKFISYKTKKSITKLVKQAVIEMQDLRFTSKDE